MTHSLYKVTRQLLDKEKETLTLLEIHKASGVPFYWLKKFSAGEMLNPSVNRVQELYEFLTNSKLHVSTKHSD